MVFAVRDQTYNVSFVRICSINLTDFTDWYSRPNRGLLSSDSIKDKDSGI
jgi:hypothetical protein